MELSIVMPVYNGELYLSECIKSILTQTFTDFELIIVDDGSTDGTLSIVESFQDPRIRLIRHKHDFIGSLNKGLEEARGKYIARMDADDLMVPERLQRQFEKMESHKDITVCGSWVSYFGDRQGHLSRYNQYIEFPQIELLVHTMMTHPAVMIRKSFLKKHQLKYKNYLYAEDYKLWTDIALKNGVFYMIPEYLVQYRISDKQVSKRFQAQQAETALTIQMELLTHLLNTAKGAFHEKLIHLYDHLWDFNQDHLLTDGLIFRLFYKILRNKSLSL